MATSTKGPFSMHRNALRLLVAATLLTQLTLALAAQAPAQKPQQGSSSSSSDTPRQQPSSSSTPRIAQPEAGGSAITLETSEPLFYIAVALNTCGYDADLAASSPVRRKIREEMNDERRRLGRRPHQPRRPLHLRPRAHPGRQRSQPRPVHLARSLPLVRRPS